MSGNKQFRKALPPGYRLVPSRSHMKVVDPNGELVRREDGRPLVVCKGGSPNHKTEQEILRQLRELP